jgi:integrative and conjugative element protein (TIGR02256 family)
MQREAERKFPKESGGVLLGYLAAEEKRHVQILAQIGPGPKARYRRDRFEPDGAWQAEQIAAAYEDSGRITTYLGDWHSHPRGGSSPSKLDRTTVKAIANTPEARAPNPLMLILFKGSEKWQLAGYRRGRRRLKAADLLLPEVA